MKDVRVFNWTQDSEATSGIWVVREDDRDHFDVVRELFQGCHVFVLKREHQDATAIVHSYLSLKHFRSPAYVADEIMSSYEYNIVSAILSAIEAFGSLENQRLNWLVQELGRMTGGKTQYDRIVYFLEVLGSIATLMNETYYASIYGCLTQRCWWLEMPEFKQHFLNVLKEIERLPEPFRKVLKEVYNKFNANLDIFLKKNIEDVFKLVSAYCLTMALYFINRKLFINAYLAIHRSLDLFFTSAAINLNLITVKRDFITYYDKDPVGEGTNEMSKIVLYTTYFAYVAKVDRLSNEEEKAISMINRKRNSLLLTHGVDAANSNETNDAYRDALKIMKRDQEWEGFLNNCKLHIRLDTSEVLYDFLGLRSILEQI